MYVIETMVVTIFNYGVFVLPSSCYSNFTKNL